MPHSKPLSDPLLGAGSLPESALRRHVSSVQHMLAGHADVEGLVGVHMPLGSSVGHSVSVP